MKQQVEFFPNAAVQETNPLKDSDALPTVWSGFYNKTLPERHDVLTLMYPRLFTSATTTTTTTATENDRSIAVDDIGHLPEKIANHMIENCIGVLGIPLGLGLNFTIDGKALPIPMAVEEPSVIAAASSAAKLVSSAAGGFHTLSTGNVMTAQIEQLNVPDLTIGIQNIQQKRQELIDYANTYLCSSMVKRGGGALDIWCRVLDPKQLTPMCSWYNTTTQNSIVPSTMDPILVVHVEVDVCEAMGANIVNTVAEGLSEQITELTKGRCGLRILTNLCAYRLTKSYFDIPIEKLAWKGSSGQHVAEKIVEACDFGIIDPFRACTNNKGILNGIDAVAVATGQDWRAIEAAAHCYASRSGQYKSLSSFQIVQQSDGTRVLHGCLELPLAVGTKGGALQSHPGYYTTHALLKKPSARQLAGILASVGLAQNFAALRALAITGIQKGHMALHARNIAIATGTPNELVVEVCAYMLGRNAIRADVAMEYLAAHEIFSELHESPPSTPEKCAVKPSMFYVQVPVPTLDEPVSINIAFDTLNKETKHLVVNGLCDSPDSLVLLGDKGYLQLKKMIGFLQSIKEVIISPTRRRNLQLQTKLTLISILLNVLSYQLVEKHGSLARAFFSQLLTSETIFHLQVEERVSLLSDLPHSDPLFNIGAPLILNLLQVFNYHVEQEICGDLLRRAILKEQEDLLRAITQVRREIVATDSLLGLREFMTTHRKRWQATMFLLLDALSLNESEINPNVVTIFQGIGKYLEWEGTIAHDLARYQRALLMKSDNAFLIWKDLNFKNSNSNLNSKKELPLSDLLREFEIVTNQEATDLWLKIWTRRDEPEAKVVCLGSISEVVEMIRRHYGQRHAKHRCDSF